MIRFQAELEDILTEYDLMITEYDLMKTEYDLMIIMICIVNVHKFPLLNSSAFDKLQY